MSVLIAFGPSVGQNPTPAANVSVWSLLREFGSFAHEVPWLQILVFATLLWAALTLAGTAITLLVLRARGRRIVWSRRRRTESGGADPGAAAS